MTDFAADEALQGARKGRPLWRDARRRFLRNRAAVTGLVVFALIALGAAFAPQLWPRAHLATQVLLGAQISLIVGFAAALVSLTVGVLGGAVAGFAGGALDALVMGFAATLFGPAVLFFVVLLLAVVPSGRPETNVLVLALAIGAVGWRRVAQGVGAEIRALRGQDFIAAARAAGAGSLRITLAHVAPNMASGFLSCVAVDTALAIALESSLSFLGLGVKAPMASLGVLIAQGVESAPSAPGLLIAPVALAAALLLALNALGEGLREAVRPSPP